MSELHLAAVESVHLPQIVQRRHAQERRHSARKDSPHDEQREHESPEKTSPVQASRPATSTSEGSIDVFA